MAKPVVSSTSPPRRNRVGSLSSDTCAQRIGRSSPSAPATSPRRSSPMASRSATVVVTVSLLRRNVQQRTPVVDGWALARELARLTACGPMPEVRMRVLVVGGAGAMGRWTVRDLTESEGVDEVVVADLDGTRAREAAGWAAARSGSNGTAQVSGLALDAADPDGLRRAFDGADVVCNCAVFALNLPVMEACADTGTHYVDLGGPVPHHPPAARPARAVRGRRGHGRGRHGRQPGRHQRPGRPGRPRPGGGGGGRGPPGRGRLRSLERARARALRHPDDPRRVRRPGHGLPATGGWSRCRP